MYMPLYKLLRSATVTQAALVDIWLCYLQALAGNCDDLA
jgi:hypothetical protein